MIAALLAAAEGVQKGVSSIQSSGVLNSGQKKRKADAERDLAAALAGDINAARSLYDGRVHAVAFSRALCEQAWKVIVSQRPDLAAQVEAQMGPLAGLPSSTQAAALSPGSQVVQNTVAAIKTDVASGVQQILTGATNNVTHAISPNAGLSIPLTRNQLYLVGAAIVALIFLPKLLRHR